MSSESHSRQTLSDDRYLVEEPLEVQLKDGRPKFGTHKRRAKKTQEESKSSKRKQAEYTGKGTCLQTKQVTAMTQTEKNKTTKWVQNLWQKSKIDSRSCRVRTKEFRTAKEHPHWSEKEMLTEESAKKTTAQPIINQKRSETAETVKYSLKPGTVKDYRHTLLIDNVMLLSYQEETVKETLGDRLTVWRYRKKIFSTKKREIRRDDGHQRTMEINLDNNMSEWQQQTITRKIEHVIAAIAAATLTMDWAMGPPEMARDWQERRMRSDGKKPYHNIVMKPTQVVLKILEEWRKQKLARQEQPTTMFSINNDDDDKSDTPAPPTRRRTMDTVDDDSGYKYNPREFGETNRARRDHEKTPERTERWIVTPVATQFGGLVWSPQASTNSSQQQLIFGGEGQPPGKRRSPQRWTGSPRRAMHTPTLEIIQSPQSMENSPEETGDKNIYQRSIRSCHLINDKPTIAWKIVCKGADCEKKQKWRQYVTRRLSTTLTEKGGVSSNDQKSPETNQELGIRTQLSINEEFKIQRIPEKMEPNGISQKRLITISQSEISPDQEEPGDINSIMTKVLAQISPEQKTEEKLELWIARKIFKTIFSPNKIRPYYKRKNSRRTVIKSTQRQVQKKPAFLQRRRNSKTIPRHCFWRRPHVEDKEMVRQVTDDQQYGISIIAAHGNETCDKLKRKFESQDDQTGCEWKNPEDTTLIWSPGERNRALAGRSPEPLTLLNQYICAEIFAQRWRRTAIDTLIRLYFNGNIIQLEVSKRENECRTGKAEEYVRIPRNMQKKTKIFPDGQILDKDNGDAPQSEDEEILTTVRKPDEKISIFTMDVDDSMLGHAGLEQQQEWVAKVRITEPTTAMRATTGKFAPHWPEQVGTLSQTINCKGTPVPADGKLTENISNAVRKQENIGTRAIESPDTERQSSLKGETICYTKSEMKNYHGNNIHVRNMECVVIIKRNATNQQKEKYTGIDLAKADDRKKKNDAESRLKDEMKTSNNPDNFPIKDNPMQEALIGVVKIHQERKIIDPRKIDVIIEWPPEDAVKVEIDPVRVVEGRHIAPQMDKEIFRIAEGRHIAPQKDKEILRIAEGRRIAPQEDKESVRIARGRHIAPRAPRSAQDRKGISKVMEGRNTASEEDKEISENARGRRIAPQEDRRIFDTIPKESSQNKIITSRDYGFILLIPVITGLSIPNNGIELRRKVLTETNGTILPISFLQSSEGRAVEDCRRSYYELEANIGNIHCSKEEEEKQWKRKKRTEESFGFTHRNTQKRNDIKQQWCNRNPPQRYRWEKRTERQTYRQHRRIQEDQQSLEWTMKVQTLEQPVTRQASQRIQRREWERNTYPQKQHKIPSDEG